MTDKIKTLEQRIAKLQANIADLDESIADDGAAMSDEQLDLLTRERSFAVARLDALQAALSGEKGKNTAAIARAAQDAKKAAAEACAKAALERADAAADIDASITALIASVLRYSALNTDMRRYSYDAGLTDINARSHSTDMRAVSGVLADALSRSGIAAKLDFIAVHGVQHTDGKTSVVDLTAKTNAKLLGAVEKALA